MQVNEKKSASEPISNPQDGAKQTQEPKLTQTSDKSSQKMQQTEIDSTESQPLRRVPYSETHPFEIRRPRALDPSSPPSPPSPLGPADEVSEEEERVFVENLIKDRRPEDSKDLYFRIWSR